MQFRNTRDALAYNCIIAALWCLMDSDKHPSVDGRIAHDASLDELQLKATLREISTRESVASAIRALDDLPYTTRVRFFCNAAQAHEHFAGIEHPLARELREDRVGFEAALDAQWIDIRDRYVCKLQLGGYAFEPATNLPVPKD
jgi:hypothetical protein